MQVFTTAILLSIPAVYGVCHRYNTYILLPIWCMLFKRNVSIPALLFKMYDIVIWRVLFSHIFHHLTVHTKPSKQCVSSFVGLLVRRGVWLDSLSSYYTHWLCTAHCSDKTGICSDTRQECRCWLAKYPQFTSWFLPHTLIDNQHFTYSSYLDSCLFVGWGETG